MNYSKDQNKIIVHEHGHAIVMASPGSGKTTTMVGRLLYLLEQGVSPRDIVVLMFNNSAQKEFSEKLSKSANGQFPVLPEVKTYHALGLAICKYLEKKGLIDVCQLEPNSKALEMMCLGVIRDIVGFEEMKELQGANNKVVEDFVAYVDLIKGSLSTPEEIFKQIGSPKKLSFFPGAFERFEQIRKNKKIRFFSDLLYDPVKKILSDHSLMDLLSNKKDYVIVDEYQDSNKCQAMLLKIIAGDRANVMVVGDVDQAIYEWRGGDPELMLKQFSKDFKNPTAYGLSHTFRYGHSLALMSNHVVTHNKNRHDTLCQAHPSNPHTDVAIWSDDDYGDATLRAVQEQFGEGRLANDMVILVRLYSQAITVELNLMKNGIYCRVDGGRSAFESKEIKNMLSLLHLANGDFKTMSVEEREQRISGLLRFPNVGLKADVIDSIAKKMAKETSSYGLQLRIADIGRIHRYQKIRIDERALLLDRIEKSRTNGSSTAFSILRNYISQSDLYEGMQYMAMSDLEFTESRERCRVFMDFIERNNGTAGQVLNFLSDIAKKSEDKTQPPVFITSIHKAKGLEWKTVIMPGLIEGLFPYEAALSDDKLMESERRLFYVGMTRAIEMLYMITPECKHLDSSTVKGKHFDHQKDLGDSPVSRFVFETRFNLSHRAADSIKDSTKLVKSENDELTVVNRYLSYSE